MRFSKHDSWRGFESPRERQCFSEYTLLTEQSASLQNVPRSHHELILWWSNAHCNPRIWEENGNEVVAGRRTLCFRVITCSAIYDISMELHQLREVAPASPRSSLSISLEIVRSCCISMGISGTVRRLTTSAISDISSGVTLQL